MISPCRSEPARDSGVSGKKFIDLYAAIASRLTPTLASSDSKNVYTRMSPSVPFMCALFAFTP
ncbi:hypothetical protein C1894_24105 [Pseudomonas sp. FW305-3-2-15-E-TSA2]|nr:hypothetical protein C1895_24505 [Pseudomonas sp. FW305-3-2-15-E-TSA4]POA36634.1 hypothetical protein C1894_24105 [Pseudomonas sp. FW305-3-2-15-E-TSA2]